MEFCKRKTRRYTFTRQLRSIEFPSENKITISSDIIIELAALIPSDFCKIGRENFVKRPFIRSNVMSIVI